MTNGILIDKYPAARYNVLKTFSRRGKRTRETMITNITVIIYSVIAAVLIVAYLPKIFQCFHFRYRVPRRTATSKRRIAVIVPARGESEVIGDLFASLAVQDYDGRRFDVNVIVNEANDPTVGIAKSYGARVFVVCNQKCKGDAIDGYFKQIKESEFNRYDAFVIVDADAVLSPNYITELNNALEYDCDIYLSRKRIKNFLGTRRDRTIFTDCSALTYAQLDDLSNIYRTKRNIPMNMCGQGMMIRRRTIAEIGGWPYRTLTEDYEMRMDCFLRGFTSMYYPYAIIYTEETLTHRADYVRRLRWLTGYSQCDARYKKKIKAQARARGKMTEGEFEYFYSLIPVASFIALSFITAFVGIGISVFTAFSGGNWLYPVLLLIVLPMGLLYLFTFIYAMLCMIAMHDSFRRIPVSERGLALMFAPFYNWEYFPIFIHSRFKAKHGWDWKPTKHIRFKGIDRLAPAPEIAPAAEEEEEEKPVKDATL